MRLFRCHYEGSLAVGSQISLSEEEARHLGQVRRVGAGDECLVINGRGSEAAARVANIQKHRITLEVMDVVRSEDSPGVPLELAPSLTRGADADDVIVHAVELGATAIRPLLAARSVVQLEGDKLQKRLDRWNRLAIEALKQCERLWLPVIHPPLHVDATVRALLESGIEPIAAVEREVGVRNLMDVLLGAPASARCFLVGPEGGWDGEELELLKKETVCVTLGGAILKAHTASLAVLAAASFVKLLHESRAGRP